jgi:putative chitinase
MLRLECVTILNEIDAHLPDATRQFRAMVLGQMAFESSHFTRTEEDLDYNSDRLIQVFPAKFNRKNVTYYAHVPERIANHIYAGINGNGDEASGDGWLYRGRGFIQITGKYNYQTFARTVPVDMVSTDLKTNVSVGVKFLLSRPGFEKAANAGDVYTCTKLINGGLNGLSDRKVWYNEYINII